MATDDEDEHRSKVLIIGAGIAGISTGEYLTKNGFNDFKILEATDRIGGRIWTYDIDNTGVKVEMGANWIHGIERNPIYQIADENGLLQLRYKDKGLRHRNIFLTEAGEQVNARIVKDVDFTYGLLIQQCEEFYQMGMPTPYDIESVGDYMKCEIAEVLESYSDNEKRLRDMIFNQHMRQEAVVSGCDDLDDVSLSEFGCYEELPGIHYTIPPGFQSVLEILVDKLPPQNILLNHPVRCVNWDKKYDGYNACVECENGEKYFANHVIVTVSLGVLKAGIERMFSPQLPTDIQGAIDRLGYGVVDKVMLYFDKPFLDSDVFRLELLWDDQKFKEEGGTGTPDMANSWYRKIYSFEVVHENLILGWLCGKEALYMESLSTDQVSEDCCKVLKKFLKRDIPRPSRVLRTRWGNNQHTRGAYCYIQVGSTIADVETLAEPVKDTASGKPVIQFAGEATHPSFYSTTHGALLTGEREAKRILDLYSHEAQ